jgi:MoaA/NifB/PqqE/SkfB family radical SAM enzyme
MNTKCLFPFTFLEFHPRGEVYCCCPAWTKYGPVGNIYHQSIEEIWNGQKIIKLRKALYQNNYQHCKTSYCPYMKSPIELTKIAKTKGLKKVIEQIKAGKLKLSTGPVEISLAHSGTCNLNCIMCRSNQNYLQPEPKQENIIFEKVIPKLLPGLEVIKLSGNGEPFFQKRTLQFLINFKPHKYPDLKFDVLTNAQLFNENLWKKIKHNNYKTIDISIDAATKSTYEKIRVGGKWERLQKNLKFISKLRKKGEFKKFYINMTVMKSNYNEIREFAQMGLDLDCDQVFFNKIFGFLNPIAEENINKFPKTKIFRDIKKQLSDPIFSSPKVNITGISEYKQLAKGKLKDKNTDLKIALANKTPKVYRLLESISWL